MIPHIEGISITKTDVYLSYLPLPHVLERIIVYATIGAGAQIAIYGGDVMKLKDDLALVRPTVFCSVPRLYNRFYDVMKSGFKKLTGVKKILANRAIVSKEHYLKNGCHYNHPVYDRLVFNKTKNAFGGRVKFMMTGSAPISSEVIEFLRIACCCPILEGYGQTESTGASFATAVNDPTSGHVGGPMANVEYKLVDLAEMKYTSDDKDDNGNPMPRGEICIRGPGVFLGYFKDTEKTTEAIDKDGWLHTGDVGQIMSNGALKIIDRKKNIFKLAQGEYIAPEKVEGIYT